MRPIALLTLFVALVAAGCGGDGADLTVYSGRSETLVGPLIADFEEASGLSVEVRYAGSTELATTIIEEGADSPADVFLAQDPASLGFVASAGLFQPLSDSILERVPARFSDGGGRWVGISGRARVAVVSGAGSELLDEDDLTEPAWRGRFGIAPSNGSFLAFVAAKIIIDGEGATRDWLEAIAANEPKRFDGNSAIVAAVDAGDIDAGLVNHYYLLRLIDEEGSSPAVNVFIDAGGAGALVMPAGAGILASTDDQEAALEFLEFLLGTSAQEYFADETFEYPLVPGVDAPAGLPPIDSLQAPDIDLSELAGVLSTATDLVAEAGLI